MASTEQRTGFRFGWGSRGDSDKAAEQASKDAQEESPESPAPEGAQSDPAVTSTDIAHAQSLQSEPPATAGDASSWPSSDMPEPASPAPYAPPPAPTQAPQSGFLADLMRAMQAAAEQNRKQVMERFHNEARGLNDAATSRSTEQVTELRRQADGDVDGIREVSKAEIARIKAETDERIAARRADLERQLEEHQALVQREAEKIQARVRAFEQQMESFFYRLQSVPDPTTFAAVAQEMPEPPQIEALAAQARAEAMAESPLGSAAASRVWDAPFTRSPEWNARTAAPAWQPPVAAPQTSAYDGPPAATAWSQPTAVETATPAATAWDQPTAAETAVPAAAPEASTWSSPAPVAHTDPSSPSDWGSPGSWQSPSGGWQSAESAAAQSVQQSSWEAQAAAPATTTSTVDSNAWTAPAHEATPTQHFAESQHASEQPIVYGAPAPFAAEALTSETDPRLSALAQSPGSDNVPGSAPAAQSPSAMPGEAFPAQSESTAARLAGLVPSSELPANGRTPESPAAPTQVVVTGLLSVASIASFKRHLSRIPGVQAVGVSSGPDGEFIFKTTHDAGLALPDAIRALPGFGAEIVSTGEGTINVAAHDPEADA